MSPSLECSEAENVHSYKVFPANSLCKRVNCVLTSVPTPTATRPKTYDMLHSTMPTAQRRPTIIINNAGTRKTATKLLA